MAFRNSILAATVLLREAIQSPNFATGVSGWIIRQDGTAEFADLVIRSSDGSGNTVIIANGKITIKNPANTTVVEIDSTGYRLYNSSAEIVAEIKLDAGGFLGGFYCRNFAAPSNIYAFLSGGQMTSGPVVNSDAAIHGFLSYVLAPTASPPYAVQTLSTGVVALTDDEARIQLISQQGQRSVVWVDGGSSSLAADLHATGSVKLNEDLVINNVTQGRGIAAYSQQTANSATFTTEAVVMTVTNVLFRTGRAYRLQVKGNGSSSVVNDRVQYRVRKTNVTGITYLNSGIGTQVLAANLAHGFCFENIAVNTSGSDLTQTVVVTGQRQAGTGNCFINGSAVDPWYLHIEDIGAAVDYPSACPIT